MRGSTASYVDSCLPRNSRSGSSPDRSMPKRSVLSTFDVVAAVEGGGAEPLRAVGAGGAGKDGELHVLSLTRSPGRHGRPARDRPRSDRVRRRPIPIEPASSAGASGWRCPQAGVDWVKAKIDTGARTSADPRLRPRGVRAGRPRAGCGSPSTRGSAPTRTPSSCELPVLDRARGAQLSTARSRSGTSSRSTSGSAGRTITTEMTLSNRDEMGFRMLVGREALRRGSSSTREVVPRRPAQARRTAAQPGQLDGPRVLRHRQRPGPRRRPASARAADHPAGHRRRRRACPCGWCTGARTGRSSGSTRRSTATRWSASR